MFLRDAWYVACWSHELGERPYPVTMLGDDVVVYRTSTGIATLEDRCPHRHAPLHLGQVEGDNIRCGYHGAVFGSDGRCVRVPSQRAAPPRARIRSYPTLERHGWIWVWMGAAEAADETLLPDLSLLTDPRLAAVGTTNRVAASYQYVVDNLMDLSHVGFVHTSTIGNASMGEKGSLKVTRDESRVQVVRWVADAPPAPLATKLQRFPPGTNIDRSQVITYLPPSCIVIHAGSSTAGSGPTEGIREHEMNFWVVNAITPIDEHNCLYFWASVRDIGVGNDQVNEMVFKGHVEAFDEDKQVLEAQQRNILKRGDSWEVTFQADAGVVEARRLLQARMQLAQERSLEQAA